MKKETKRYSLLEYLGKTKRVVNSMKEYDEFVDFIKKWNKRSTVAMYFGNITKEAIDNQIYITVHIYKRLTPPSTISDLTNEHLNYKSKKELLEFYRTKTEYYNPDIYIGYFETRNSSPKKQEEDKKTDVRIKPLPILYECDKKYLEESYIKKCLIVHANANDIGFFMDLCDEFCEHRVIGEALDKMRKTINDVRYEGLDPFLLSVSAMGIYYDLIRERDVNGVLLRDKDGKYEISKRRQRDFGTFIRDYDMLSRKRLSATRFNVAVDPRNIGKPPVGEELKIKYKNKR